MDTRRIDRYASHIYKGEPKLLLLHSWSQMVSHLSLGQKPECHFKSFLPFISSVQRAARSCPPALHQQRAEGRLVLRSLLGFVRWAQFSPPSLPRSESRPESFSRGPLSRHHRQSLSLSPTPSFPNSFPQLQERWDFNANMTPSFPLSGLWGLPATFGFFTDQVPNRSSAGSCCLSVTASLAVAIHAFAVTPSVPFLPLQLPSSCYTIREAFVGRILMVPALSSGSHMPVEASLPRSVHWPVSVSFDWLGSSLYPALDSIPATVLVLKLRRECMDKWRTNPTCLSVGKDWKKTQFSSVQSLSRVRLFVTPWTAACQGFHHQLPEFTQTHVHRVSDAIQPSHPLSSPSSPAFRLSQHQGLFKWVIS